MPRVGHQGLRVPGEPVCKAGEARPEEGWGNRPFPISLFRRTAEDVERPEAVTEALCCPHGGTQALPGHPAVRLGEWSLRSCNEPSHCAWLTRVIASHPQDKSLASTDRGPLTVQ